MYCLYHGSSAESFMWPVGSFSVILVSIDSDSEFNTTCPYLYILSDIDPFIVRRSNIIYIYNLSGTDPFIVRRSIPPTYPHDTNPKVNTTYISVLVARINS